LVNLRHEEGVVSSVNNVLESKVYDLNDEGFGGRGDSDDGKVGFAIFTVQINVVFSSTTKDPAKMDASMLLRRVVLTLLFLVLYGSPSLAQETASSPSAKRISQYTEEGSEGCLVCHSGEKMRAIAISPHANPDHPSAPLTQKGCEGCHGPGSIHVSRAHGGKGFPKMILFGGDPTVSERDEQIDACLSCHTEDLGSTQAIEFRDSVHDKQDDKQDDKQLISCSNCHVIHAEFAVIRQKEQQAEICYTCHEKTKAEHPRFEDKSIDFDALSCWDCHDVHKANAEQN